MQTKLFRQPGQSSLIFLDWVKLHPLDIFLQWLQKKNNLPLFSWLCEQYLENKKWFISEPVCLAVPEPPLSSYPFQIRFIVGMEKREKLNPPSHLILGEEEEYKSIFPLSVSLIRK